MNNPAISSGVSKGTCAPRAGELDPHLSRSAYSDPMVPFRVFRVFVSEIWVSLKYKFDKLKT